MEVRVGKVGECGGVTDIAGLGYYIIECIQIQICIGIGIGIKEF